MSEIGAAHILVVDDDMRLRELLQRYLLQNGFLVTVAADVEEAKAKLRNLAFDLLVLDVMLPGQDGVSFTGELRRADADVPVLLLTARGEPEDRIGGLEAGADDYLVKPFEPRELLLRISTILRRVQANRADEIVRFGPFAFNRANGELRRDDEVVHLTTGEIALLQVLAAKPGKPVARADLGDQGRVAGSDRAVDVQMARLRRKIEDDPRQPRYLLTARGSGYVLRPGS
jgi:two-component system phosphate regulon response regulator OmpR